jgi:hypothetical protein
VSGCKKEKLYANDDRGYCNTREHTFAPARTTCDTRQYG